MKITITYFIFTLFVVMNFSATRGQQMVYQPVNPNFGGNPMNYSGLLASAEAQNPFQEDGLLGQFDQSPLSQFSDSVKRQILSELTGNLLGKGETEQGGIEPGTSEVGGLVVKVEETRSGSVITIIDTDTGESTQIIL